MDGAEANDAGGGVRSTLSQEAVQEFQINRSNYAAEFGGASGGVINIVSKSGSNNFHGRAFGFFRHDKLDAGDPFAIELVGTTPQRIKPPSQRQQYGGTLSFPVRKDRTFFFGGFEGLNRDESSAVPVLTDLSDLSAHDGSNRNPECPGFQYQHRSDRVPAGGAGCCDAATRGLRDSVTRGFDQQAKHRRPVPGQQRRFSFHHKLESLLGANRPQRQHQ